jgi:predicted phosphodiesterase
MRIAVLADIHGNLVALEAALEHMQRLHPDYLIIAGDMVNGAPDSHACWKLCHSLQVPLLFGNHERYVADFDTPRALPDWSKEHFGPVRWAASQFNQAEQAQITALPRSLSLPEFPEILFVHASLRADRDTIQAATPADELTQMFPGSQATLIVRAHNHEQRVRLWGNRTIVTTGSVGMALDLLPHVQYLVLEYQQTGWQIQHQSVPYDLTAATRRFETTGYREAAGPMTLLYLREMLTASSQIVPFLRLEQQWLAEQPTLSLSAAVDRFYSQRW